MKTVEAKNAIMFGLYGGEWFAIGCETDFAFHYINEIITKTDRNAGGNRKYRVRISDSEGTVQGIVTTESDDQTLSIFYYTQEAIRWSEQQFKFRWQDDFGANKEITATFIIKDINLPTGSAGFATFEMQLQGTSGVELDPVDVPDGDDDDGIDYGTWNLAEGSASITGNSTEGRSFENKYILMVSRSGASYKLVTGAPGNLEAQITDDAINFLNAGNEGGEDINVIWRDDNEG